VRILVLGIGNTIMGDDSVGIHVARTVKARLQSRTDLDVKELGVGGLKLVEEMLGYEEAIIVDSYSSSDSDPGRIREFYPEQFQDTLHASSPHGTNFATALQLYRRLAPERIPGKIRIFTVDIHATQTFGEDLSPTIRDAASRLAESIIRLVEETHEG
jgi:hydrogenase maturation protease